MSALQRVILNTHRELGVGENHGSQLNVNQESWKVRENEKGGNGQPSEGSIFDVVHD